MTPAGIELATFRFVAQHLNHCATAVRTIIIYVSNNTVIVNNYEFFLNRILPLEIQRVSQRFSSKFTYNLGTRPKKVFPALLQ